MTDKPDMSLVATTQFAYKNVGYGVISYEGGNDFDRYEDGALFTDTFDRDGGLQWGRGEWFYDGGLGMRTSVIKRDDMTDAQISEAWGQVDA